MIVPVLLRQPSIDQLSSFQIRPLFFANAKLENPKQGRDRAGHYRMIKSMDADFVLAAVPELKLVLEIVAVEVVVLIVPRNARAPCETRATKDRKKKKKESRHSRKRSRPTGDRPTDGPRRRSAAGRAKRGGSGIGPLWRL